MRLHPNAKLTPAARLLLVERVLKRGFPVARAAREAGVSRQTAYKWLDRFEASGRSGLQDASRAPKSHPNQTDEAVGALIISVRRRHPTWGPVKILQYLRNQGEDASLLSELPLDPAA